MLTPWHRRPDICGQPRCRAIADPPLPIPRRRVHIPAMAVLKIVRMGHPALARPANPVPDPSVPEIHQLVADMVDTLEDAGGIGLAATQVAVPLRLVMFFVPALRTSGEAGDEPVPLTILANPVIEALDDEQETEYEACLSVPGLTGPVPRWRRIRYRGVSPTGESIEREASGFHARVVQHECDHLDGILYPMRMADLSKLAYVDQLKELESPEGRRAAAEAEAADERERVEP
jgi:peptide deformylase